MSCGVKLCPILRDWFHGPRRYTPRGEVSADEELIVVNPACRFGAQQVDELGAADDPKRGSTNEATFAKIPISFPY